jgi:FeS assembly SUF system regulator
MFKVSRLTDYGLLLLCAMASRKGESLASARDLSEITKLPLPTVSKLLKLLAKSSLVNAKRGVLGGYELMSHPKDISLFSVITVFEGSPALTDCIDEHKKNCQMNGQCPQKNAWHLVQEKVAKLLRELSLFDLMADGKSLE